MSVTSFSVCLHDNIRVIAIDPGSSSAGFSILELNPETLEITIVRSETVKTKDVIGRYKDFVDILGERLCRNLGYMDYLSHLLDKWRIDFVICEAAYAGRFIAAFKALTEHVTLLKIAVRKHNKRMAFLMVEPSVIKKGMGVKGNSGDKSLMYKALISDKSVNYCDTLDIDNLDEHSVDSCCIGIVVLKRVAESRRLLSKPK